MLKPGNADLHTTANGTVLKAIVKNGFVGLSLEERMYPCDSAVEGGVDRRRWDLRSKEIKGQRDGRRKEI